MRHKLTMANALSALRIVLSVALLAPPALSSTFLTLYAMAGLTDMLDGYVARRTKTESELGAKLDSAADLALTAVCLAKVLSTVAVPAWLWAWVAAIAIVKVVNAVSGLVMRKRLVMPTPPQTRQLASSRSSFPLRFRRSESPCLPSRLAYWRRSRPSRRVTS